MAKKSKITASDFLDMLDEQDGSSGAAAFRPSLPEDLDPLGSDHSRVSTEIRQNSDRVPTESLETTVLNKFDTEPTQSNQGTRHKADTNLKEEAWPVSTVSDTKPTQRVSNKHLAERLNAHSQHISDTKPTQVVNNTKPDIRHKADTNATQTEDETRHRFGVPNFTAEARATDNDTIPTTQKNEYRQSTDKITKVISGSEYRQSTDNFKWPTRTDLISSTDNVPTTNFAQIVIPRTFESLITPNTDKIPTTDLLKFNIEYRQSTDNASVAKSDEFLSAGLSIDAISTDKIPTKSRQKKIAAVIPTKSQQRTDKEPTIVPTTEKLEYRQSTDNGLVVSVVAVESMLTLLAGGQRTLMNYAYKQCLNRASNHFSTRYPDLAQATGIPDVSIRTTAKILKGRGLLEIKFGKGPGGLLVISIPDLVFRTWARLNEFERVNTDKLPTTNKSEYRQITDNRADKRASSSSSNLINTTTDREEPALKDLERIRHIDLSAVKGYGITEAILVRGLELEPHVDIDALEALVYRYGVYIKTPDAKNIRSHTGIFLTYVKALGKGITPLDSIETPDEILMRKAAEKSIKARAEKLERENLFWSIEFEKWASSLTSDQKRIYKPEGALADNSRAVEVKLRNIFDREIKPRVLASLKLEANA